MGWVTKEQIAHAREMPVLDYILSYESGDYKRVGAGYRLKTDNALAVDENGWYCHKRNIGSRTALDYLVEIKGYGLVNAVCALLGENPQAYSGKAKIINPPNNSVVSAETPLTADDKSLKQSLIILPIRNKDNRRVIAYLQSRGIDLDLIIDCINRGVLYESKDYHNAVFLGKDENGKTKFAAMRSTTVNFMRDADGSDKKYGFVLPPDNPRSNTVAVYESPIDCLSHQTLCKQGYIPPFDGWRLSLGCVSTAALEHFITQHSEIIKCIVCTDNDKAGETAAEKIANIKEINSVRSLPLHGKDWNETLQAVKKAERTQNKVRDSTYL